VEIELIVEDIRNQVRVFATFDNLGVQNIFCLMADTSQYHIISHKDQLLETVVPALKV